MVGVLCQSTTNRTAIGTGENMGKGMNASQSSVIQCDDDGADCFVGCDDDGACTSGRSGGRVSP
jgi:hypothetical protein